MSEFKQIKLPNGSTYDVVDKKVAQSKTTENANLPIIIKTDTGTTNTTGETKFATNVTINPSTGTLKATKLAISGGTANQILLGNGTTKAVGDFVDLTSSQTITGVKTISNGIILPTASTWTNTYRGIPFSFSDNVSKIGYVNTATTSGLTYNPATGDLKCASFNGFTIAKSVPADAVFTDTTYNIATQSTSGLLSSFDKAKLDGIDEHANNYIHPNYTAKSSGLYKITVDETGHVSATTSVTSSDISASGGLTGLKLNGTAVTPTSGVVSINGVTSFGGQNGAITIDTGTTTNGTVKFAMSSKKLTGSVVGLGSAAYTTTIALENTMDSKDTATLNSAKEYANGLVASAVHIKGSKSTVAEVEAIKGATIGDLWFVTADGSEWVATATAASSASTTTWEELGKVGVNGALYKDSNTFTDGHVLAADGTTGKVKDTGFTIGKSVPSDAVFTDTDTKVTSAANHYSPTSASTATIEKNATGATAAWSIDVVKGIKLYRDSKGHITDAAVVSGKIPANPNTDTKVTQTATNSATGNYPILFKNTTGTTDVTDTSRFATALKYQPSTGTLSATKFSGNGSGLTNVNAATVNGKTIAVDVPSTAVFTDTITSIDGNTGALTLGTNLSISGATINATDTTYSNATTSAAGLMSSTDKSKLDGIATGANKYTHPTYTSKSAGIYKFTVDGTGHVNGTTAITKSDITSLGIPEQDTTYNDATTSVHGLMSTADKTKLNGIESGATKTTESTISGWGFTKNTGTVTSVKINGTTKSPTSGVVDLGTVITEHQDISGKADRATTLAGYGITDAKIASGKITLGSNTITPLTSSSNLDATKLQGTVPTACLPSYVDDVIEGYYYNNKFYTTSSHTTEITPESGKIYVDLVSNKTYRWGGSAYVVISETLAIGTTTGTAADGGLLGGHTVESDVPANAKFTDTDTKVSQVADASDSNNYPLLTKYSNNKTDETNSVRWANSANYTPSTGTLTAAYLSGDGSGIRNVNAATVNNHTVQSDVPSGAKFTDTVTTVTTSGSGNAITAISASNGAITATKGSTFLTSVPVASSSVLGGVKINGNNLSINTSGVLSATDEKVSQTAITGTSGSYNVLLGNEDGSNGKAYMKQGSLFFDVASNALIAPGFISNGNIQVAGFIKSTDAGIQANGPITTTGNISSTNGIFSGNGSGLTNVNAALIDGHAVYCDVPSDAVFTDTKVTQNLKSNNVSYPLLLKYDSTSNTVTNSANFATTITYNPSSKKLTVGGEIQGNSITSTGTITASGNITANAFIGDGSQLTNLPGGTDTKNTAGSSQSTSKLYLVGALSQSSEGVQTYSNSNVYTQNGAIYATSDERKKNIEGEISLEKAYDMIDKCTSIIYTLKDDESSKKQIGVIAQEVREFFPEIVNEDEEGFFALDYSRLTVILMRVMKDIINRLNKIEK